MDGAKKPAFIPKLQQERITYLIKRLLLHDTYNKMDDLADEIYVSKSTIQNDLIDVKKLVAEYEIVVESRPNYGLKISGKELNIRFCMSEYIFDRRENLGERLIDPHSNVSSPQSLYLIY